MSNPGRSYDSLVNLAWSTTTLGNQQYNVDLRLNSMFDFLSRRFWYGYRDDFRAAWTQPGAMQTFVFPQEQGRTVNVVDVSRDWETGRLRPIQQRVRFVVINERTGSSPIVVPREVSIQYYYRTPHGNWAQAEARGRWHVDPSTRAIYFSAPIIRNMRRSDLRDDIDDE